MNTKERRKKQARKRTRKPGPLLLLALLMVGAGVLLRQRVAFLPKHALSLRFANSSPQSAPSAPSGPPAERSAGAVTQGPFTLVAVTRAQANGFEGPEEFAANLDYKDARHLSGSADSTGLWIRIAGGIGAKKLTVGEQGASWQFGHWTLSIPALSSNRASAGYIPTNWEDSQRKPTAWSASMEPYQVSVPEPPGSRPAPVRPLLLLPRDLNRHFVLTATPLDSADRPLGGFVTLSCQPVGPDVLFAPLPPTYPEQTRGFALQIARLGDAPASAIWRLTRLPRTEAAFPKTLPLQPRLTFGALTLTATAAQTTQYWPDFYDYATLHAPPPVLPLSTPSIACPRDWTGLPLLRCQLTAQAAGQSPDERWAVHLTQARALWQPSPQKPSAPVLPSRSSTEVKSSGPPSSGATTAQTLPRLVPLMPVLNVSSTLDQGGFAGAPAVPSDASFRGVWNDILCGPLYPGPQNCLVEGTALHYVYRTQTLVFHNADLQFNPRRRCWQLTWQEPQTQTTPEGVRVTVLNPHLLSSASHASSEPALANGETEALVGVQYLSGTPVPVAEAGTLAAAELLPPGVVMSLAFGPPLQGAPRAVSEACKTDWGDVWPPGAPAPLASRPLLTAQGDLSQPLIRHSPSPLEPLLRAHYEPQSVRGAFSASSLTRHFPTVTLRVRLRLLREQHRFRLVVPVAFSKPARNAVQ